MQEAGLLRVLMKAHKKWMNYTTDIAGSSLVMIILHFCFISLVYLF